jgi:hypothetical protein
MPVNLATDQTDQTHLTLFLTNVTGAAQMTLLAGAWQPTSEDQRVWEGVLQADGKALTMRLQIRDVVLDPEETSRRGSRVSVGSDRAGG